MSYRIDMVWDKEASVWIATSKDVPGLILESGSSDTLAERVKHAVPELIELNGFKPSSLSLSFFQTGKIRFQFMAEYEKSVRDA